eukprot:1160277-Pelagomonas_calceolata.AAC.16
MQCTALSCVTDCCCPHKGQSPFTLSCYYIAASLFSFADTRTQQALFFLLLLTAANTQNKPVHLLMLNYNRPAHMLRFLAQPSLLTSHTQPTAPLLLLTSHTAQAHSLPHLRQIVAASLMRQGGDLVSKHVTQADEHLA